MFKEIQIEFPWSKELAVEASKKFYDYDMRHSAKRYIGWIFVALTQFGIVGALKHDSYGLLYLSTFFVVYWYYGRWYIRKSLLEKFYDKENLAKTQINFTLQKDGLLRDEKLISWDQIFRVMKIEEGVLLHIENSTLFFKREAFQSYEDMIYFLELMKQKEKI